jgi:hypothetical protein
MSIPSSTWLPTSATGKAETPEYERIGIIDIWGRKDKTLPFLAGANESSNEMPPLGKE